MPFDRFGDHATRGYLRTSPARLTLSVSGALSTMPSLQTSTAHSRLCGVRLASTMTICLRPTASCLGQPIPGSARIALIAHPRDIRRAVEYGLGLARQPHAMLDRPGEVFDLLT